MCIELVLVITTIVDYTTTFDSVENKSSRKHLHTKVKLLKSVVVVTKFVCILTVQQLVRNQFLKPFVRFIFYLQNLYCN